MQGRVIKTISDDYTVLVDTKEYVCKGKGKLRHQHITPIVGDIVEIDIEDKMIKAIEKRKNELIRPKVANVDQAYIIVSVKHPNLDLNLLDKLLAIIEYNTIQPIICLTKLDLLTPSEQKNIIDLFSYYQKIGYDVILNTDLNQMKASFNNKISIFVGQTGAGKSTLLNHLETSLNLRTNEISEALGRGKNTTTHVQLLKIAGGWVADSPGFSDVYFGDMSKEDIRDNFVEFNKYKQNCEYRDCMHLKETTCAIKDQVKKGGILTSRYENYIKFISR